ncbi:MAG: helix-turn-helix transcriptional regulator [Vicinamibacterales bacterium]
MRQWRIVLALEGRARGLTLADIRDAAGDGVTERTIRRDLDALAQAGFPIESARNGGPTRYSLNREVYRGLSATGFTLQELCALYLSRTLLQALAGGPFQDSLESAFDKLADALPPRLWAFIDRLPQALTAKAPGAPGPVPGAAGGAVGTLMTAILGRRRVRMRYHSFSSAREKEYLVEPYRLAYAQGALYLFAFVPEYGEMRTFATQRVRAATALEDTFDPGEEPARDAFPDAFGVFSGPPEPVTIDFTARAAPYVRERQWHPSQTVEDLPDGAVRLHLHVAVDWSLQAWILGFGQDALVVAPQALAETVASAARAAAGRYS